MMSGIRGKNTKPEMILRQGLHRAGFRFRLHDKNLPGKPDLVFPKYRAVIFAHGCFWHGHDCHLFRLPATRTEFWAEKIRSNVLRDREVEQRLHDGGWRNLVVWECALKGRTKLGADAVLNLARRWVETEERSTSIRGK